MIKILQSKALAKGYDLDKLFKSEGFKSVTYINAISYHNIRGNLRYLRNIDTILIDGLILVALLNFFKIKTVSRYTFDMTSVAPVLFEFCIKNNKSIHFIGSDKNSLHNFVNVISNEYPRLKIAGYQDGYFEWNNKDRIIDSIWENSPDFLVIGLGTPLQEKFMSYLSVKFSKKKCIAFACGGFIHQTQTSIYYYPKLINRLGLRMPYRLFKERLYNRLPLYPQFLFYFLKDYVYYLKSK